MSDEDEMKAAQSELEEAFLEHPAELCAQLAYEIASKFPAGQTAAAIWIRGVCGAAGLPDSAAEEIVLALTGAQLRHT